MGAGIDLDRAEALINAGRIADAVAILEKFVARKSRESRALHLLGVAKAMLGQHQQAETLLRHAHALKPQATRIATDLAIALIMQRRNEEALALLDKVRKREPDYRLAAFYRGVALTNLYRQSEAIEVFAALSKLEPDNELYAQNHATALAMLRRFDEAEPIADRLLARRTTTEALLVKSQVLLGREAFSEAIALYDQILAREPDHADAAHNRGYIRLLTLDLAGGWPDYEARLRLDHHRADPPCDGVPRWSGEPLRGKSLLVYAEQGLGDIMLICRYLPQLAELCSELFFRVPGAMIRLVRSACDRVQVLDKIPRGQSFDFQVPMMSLPLCFATSPATIPAKVPYLFAEPDKVAHWHDVIGDEGFKIGIVWQGNPNPRIDFGRSIPLAAFQPLSEIPGVRLISLQKVDGLEQLDHLPDGMHVEQLDSSGTDGFLDTAAVMMNLDLIVGCDTATINLAGALGLPVCTVSRRVPDWRWTLGERTPWYPTAVAFRKNGTEDWPALMQRVAAHARDVASARS